jgi:hypothetical protein
MLTKQASAWAEGDGATLTAALGAAACVVAELDVGGCGTDVQFVR